MKSIETGASCIYSKFADDFITVLFNTLEGDPWKNGH